MIIPGTLIFGIRKVGVFEQSQIFLDDGKRQDVRLVLRGIRRSYVSQKLASVVPSRVVGEVLVDDCLGHVAFLLEERVLD